MTLQAISFSEWYETGPFSAFVKERKLAGTHEVRMLHAVQPPGDLSDPPTSDMVLAIAHRSSFTIEADYGFKSARLVARHGTCFLRPPGAAASIRIDHRSRLRFFAFRHSVIDDFAQASGSLGCLDFGHLHSAPFRCDFVEQLCDRLWEAAGRSGDINRLYCDHATMKLVSELQSEAGRRAFSSSGRGGLAPRQLSRVCEAMVSHLQQGLHEPGLVALASLAGLSPNHFCKAFKVSTGLPPHRWLSQRRIERARMLLRTTSWPLTDIALALGYGSHSAFGTAFRRETGLMPNAYRESLR